VQTSTIKNDDLRVAIPGSDVMQEQGSASLSAFSESLVAFLPVVDHVVASELRRVPGIEAVFIGRDEDGVYQVFSVVQEHDRTLYAALLESEARIAQQLPEGQFDFHVRAHQGRSLSLAVPPGLERVYF
jgi:hypothetical protein